MKQYGFSLIELMISVAVVGILAAVAYPSYQDSVNKSRRADAHDSLLRLHLAQEKLRGNCRFYAGVIDTVGTTNTCAASAALTKVVGSTASNEGNYTVAVSNEGTATYTLTATATGAQASDTACAKIILEVTNTDPDGNKTGKTSANATSDVCW